MSVSGQLTSISYTSPGGGPTPVLYSIPYYFMALTDMIVQVNTAGTITTAVANTDYVIGGTPNSYGAYPNGGDLTWLPGRTPTAGAIFTITRTTARIQPDTYLDNNPFPATVNESDLDRLTLIAQEISAVGSGFIGLLQGPPTSGSFIIGDWFIVTPPTPGDVWGYICTASGAPGTWNAFGQISL